MYDISREISPPGTCLPRECSQTMFIVLGGFQGGRAGNDGSWSPGKLLQARRMQGSEREVRERKKKKKDVMKGHVVRRKKTQSVYPGRM